MDKSTRAAAAIEADYERWRVWLSDSGKWWAARKESLTADELSAGCVSFLQADDPDDLRQKIDAEEQLTGQLCEKSSVSGLPRTPAEVKLLLDGLETFTRGVVSVCSRPASFPARGSARTILDAGEGWKPGVATVSGRRLVVIS
jgi:hypothetical protein